MQSLTSRCFFVLVVMFGSLTLPAYGDTVYTYTGNPFDTWAPGFSCPNVCNVTGSFTLSSPLAPNLPDGTVVVPIAATLFSSGVTLTLADVDVNDFSQFTLAISTDALGNITGWTFLMVGPANTARILAQSRLGFAPFDDIRFVDALGNLGPVAGIIGNDPGTWTATSAVPEPSSLLLLGSGALGLIGVVRRKTRV